jgi:DNA polymerase III sliding clamp (beta) subunit (PCNA family)
LNVINIDGHYVTATDGHRIHREIIVPASNELFPSVLIPENAVPVLTEICGRLEAEDEIELQYFSVPKENSQDSISFVRVDCSEANREFIVQLVDAKASDYERAIPSAVVIPHKIFLESDFLERALSRMRKVVPHLCQPTLTLSADSVKLKLVSKDDDTYIEMALSARSIQFRPQAKRIVEEVNGETVEREEIPTEVSVGFDAAYMMDAIDGTKGEIVMSFSDSLSPMRVDVSPTRLAIVMPVRP